MADNKVFNNPFNFGYFDLTTSQLDKTMQFAWDAEVIPQAKIVAKYGTRTIKTL